MSKLPAVLALYLLTQSELVGALTYESTCNRTNPLNTWRYAYIHNDFILEVVAIDTANFENSQRVTFKVEHVYKGDISVGDTFWAGRGTTWDPRIEVGETWIYVGNREGDMMSSVGRWCSIDGRIGESWDDSDREKLYRRLTGDGSDIHQFPDLKLPEVQAVPPVPK